MAEHSIDQRQRDIEFGNTFRLEYVKHLITVASGVFVFTVAFMKDAIAKPAGATSGLPLLITGWLALVVSIVAGIHHMRYWAWFFVSWGRGPEDAGEIAWRTQVDSRRKFAEKLQFYGFTCGMILLFVFAAINLSH